jgi:hypothetical protein
MIRLLNIGFLPLRPKIAVRRRRYFCGAQDASGGIPQIAPELAWIFAFSELPARQKRSVAPTNQLDPEVISIEPNFYFAPRARGSAHRVANTIDNHHGD